MNDIAAFATHTPLLSVVFSLQVSSYNSFFLVSILTNLQERFAFTKIFSTFVYSNSPKPLKKMNLQEAIKAFISEERAKEEGEGKQETLNALEVLMLAYIEAAKYSEGAEEAKGMIQDALNAEAENRVSYLAEEQAEDAEYCIDEWESPKYDRDGVCAWSVFAPGVDLFILYEEAFSEALPNIKTCECGHEYTGDYAACPACEQLDFERAHTNL